MRFKFELKVRWLIAKAKKMAAVIIRVAVAAFLFSCQCDKGTDLQNATNPRVVWSYDKPANFLEAVQPVIDNGKVYVASDTSIVCVELVNGKKIWSKGLGITNSIKSGKLLHSGGMLFQNHSLWVKAFEKTTGNLVWKVNKDASKAIDLSIMAQNSTHLFLGERGFVLRISKLMGNVDLTIQLDSLVSPGTVQNGYDPQVSETEGYLYVPTGIPPSQNFPAFRGNVFCYNSQTGEYVWGFRIPNKKILLPGLQDSTILDAAAYGCAIQDSFIVFPAGRRIYALNRFTGTLKWEKVFDGDSFGAGAVIQGNTIYVGSQAGASVYAIDLATAQILWRTKTQGSIFNLLTVLDNRVYLCNGLDGQIWVFNSSNGNVIWRSFPPDYYNDSYAVYSSNLAVGEGYMVDVGSKKVYCLSTP